MKCVTENVNVNVVINFLLFLMHWKVSGRKKKTPTVVLKLMHIVIFFLNERVKEMRRQKAKRRGYPFGIP